jgi:hypothetical protein
MEILNCKCGSQPSKPQKVNKLKSGYFIKCSKADCNAKVQRIGMNACVSAWNEMSQ